MQHFVCPFERGWTPKGCLLRRLSSYNRWSKVSSETTALWTCWSILCKSYVTDRNMALSLRKHKEVNQVSLKYVVEFMKENDSFRWSVTEYLRFIQLLITISGWTCSNKKFLDFAYSHELLAIDSIMLQFHNHTLKKLTSSTWKS